MGVCLKTAPTPVTEEPFGDSRFLALVTLRQCGGIYNKAKGPQRSRFLETPGSTGIPICLASLYESVRFVLFKATFHTLHKTSPYVTLPFQFQGYLRPMFHT